MNSRGAPFWLGVAALLPLSLGMPAAAEEGRVSLSAQLPVTQALPAWGGCSAPGLVTPACWRNFSRSFQRPGAADATEEVTFEAYVPPETKRVRSVFLMTRHGIGSVDQPRLRAFAQRNAAALIAVNGAPLQRGFHPADVLDPYIKRLAAALNHPEIATAPMITFGHSNGTGFSGFIASQQPDRVLAWISYHSGASYHLQFPNTDKIPSLVIHGPKDPFFSYGQLDTVRRLRRERNAPATLVIEPVTPHYPVDAGQNATWEFIAQYAEAVLRTRLTSDGRLRPVDIRDGWIGAPYDMVRGGLQHLAVAPYARYQGDPAAGTWLPDAKFARVWQRYCEAQPR